MTTTTISKVYYKNRDGSPREWWFRQDPSQPANSSATLAIDPPVTLCPDAASEARTHALRGQLTHGWTNVSIVTTITEVLS